MKKREGCEIIDILYVFTATRIENRRMILTVWILRDEKARRMCD
jgi:hypothetical protein